MLAGSPYVGPHKSTYWIKLPWISDMDSHNFSLVSSSPGPKISIRDPPALAFRHGVATLSNGGNNIQKQVSPCRKSLEESSSQFRHGSGSVVTPPVPSRSKSVSRDLSFRKKFEGVSKDLAPARNHLEESSSQFRQGLTCFVIRVLHTYLTCQACAILPGQ